MNAIDWALLIILAIVWGGSFFFVEVGLEALPPFSLVVLRVGVAAITLQLFLLLRGGLLPLDRTIWLAFLGMGLLNNAVPFALITWGQTEISSSLAAILNAITPMFTVVVAHIWTSDEKLTKARMFGVVAGLAGVTFMVGPDALAGIRGDVVAQLAVVAATVSYAFAAVFGRRFARLGLTPVQAATGQLTAATVLLLPVVLVWDQPWTLPAPSVTAWLAVFGLALFSTAFAYVLYFRILASAGATNLLLVTLLVPVSAGLLGVSFLGERITADQLIGMLMIGLGLAAIDGRALKVFRPRHAS